MSILHIAHTADWEKAVEEGEYRVSTRGATLDEVGFIHCSREDQVQRIAEFVFADDTEPIVVLQIDDEALRASGVPVREEDGGDGELFPHVYGPIGPVHVIAVIPAAFIDGRFAF